MKNTVALVTLAAGLSRVAATGFHNAPSFSCPDNTDNQCTDKQSSGFDWSDLSTGDFSIYGGFQWSGFTCEDSFSKRDLLAPRTNSFQSKCVAGAAKSEKSSSPSFGCDTSSGVEKTSIKEFQVTPEFDCDLEFHYDMPDGSTCKHRNACKSSGTTITNSQCGGAKNVTIVYPSQPSMPKETCSFGFHSISFDCSSASSTKHVTKTVSSSKYSETVPAYTTSSPAESTYVGSSSFPAFYSSSTAAVTASTSVYETASVPQVTGSSVPATSSVPETPATSAETSAESSVEVPSYTAEIPATSEVPSGTSSTVAVETESSVVPSTTTYLTSYQSTSTVFSTVVSTITSCAPTVTNCPASSTALVTVTVAISTTLCPVTETHTSVIGSTEVPVPGTTAPVEKPTTVATEKPATEKSTTIVPTGGKATSATEAVGTTSTSPAGSVETLPCPSVVPSCLNTWLFSVGCTDNTDTSCYCPDSAFVQNVFSCIAAHGESDDAITEAISYFQGICGQYVGANPGVATGAESLTSYITATPTTVPSAVYTTIIVDATTVVPCTGETGETITGSSSTVTVSTVMTVPQVGFTTYSAGTSASVGVVPVTTYSAAPIASATPVVGASSTAATGTRAIGASSTLVVATSAPVGTGSYKPTTTSPGQAIVTAGAAHIGSGLGFLGLAAMAVAAL